MATPAGNNPAFRGVWNAPPGVTGHTGEPIPPESVFFVAPPPEIGEIRSAYASLKAGAKTRSRSARTILAVIWAVVPILVAVVIVVLGGPDPLETAVVFGIGILLSALAAVIAWNVTRFKHACEFVGSEGCIALKCRDAVENVTVEKSLRFKDAASLSISMTRYYKGGSYRNTMYHFQWFSPQSERVVFFLLGWIDEKKGTPPAGDAYNFGRAIENAWYGHLVPKLQDELRASGSVSFQMDSKRFTRLGPGFIEIVEKDGAIHRCEAGDIGSAKLASGTFKITRKDSESRFFGLLAPSGEYQFDYANMHNGRAFLFAFENLLGLKLG